MRGKYRCIGIHQQHYPHLIINILFKQNNDDDDAMYVHIYSSSGTQCIG